MEDNTKSTKGTKIFSIIKFAIIIVMLIFAISFYKTHNFNDFVKAESNIRISKFERDTKTKCIEENSYKITNPSYNDAMFFETVKVKPATSYKVTCKIKTQDVKRKNEYSDSGAHICISGTTEKSDNVIGTTDWTEVKFYFNSKNREEVDIGFRLGGFEDECTRNSMVFRF